MTAGPRPPLVAAAVLALVALTGCSSGSARTPVSSDARDALAARVLDLVSGNGIPVEDDHIDCSPGLDGRSVTCLGLTSSEPVQRIKGDFSSAAPADGSAAGCPGTLTVTIGPSVGYLDGTGPVRPLSKEETDPCR